jgi:hypothetical protein
MVVSPLPSYSEEGLFQTCQRTTEKPCGAIVPRPKHLSKKYGGWHTVLGPEEIESVIAGNPEIVVVGCGHFGVLPIRPETHALLGERGVAIECARLHKAIKRYDSLAGEGKRVAAVLHVTC